MKNISFQKASFNNFFLTSIREDRDEDKDELIKCRYQIPDFQRGYVWGNINIDRLIKSIVQQNCYNYYGNIVILSASKGNNDFLIDGQQRFVTLSLILSVLSDKQINEKTKEKINSFLFRDNTEPKISFANKDNYDYYVSILSKKDTKKFLHTPFTKKISSAVRNIRNNSIIKGLDSDLKIELFIEKISRMEFGAIVCDELDKAYSLFDTLNSTGVTLTSSEKIKNAILEKVHEFADNSQYNKVSKLWRSFEKKFEERDITMMNRFLRHQFYLYEKGKVSDKQLYSRMKTKVIDKISSFSDIELYINKQLELDVYTYLDIRSEDPKLSFLPKQENKIFDNIVVNYIKYINTLNLEQIYPLLLSLCNFGLKNDQYFKSGKFRKHIQMFWFFSLVAKYSSILPNQYETKFVNLCYRDKNESYSKYCSRVDDFIKKDMHNILKDSCKKFQSNFSLKYNDQSKHFAFDLLYNILNPSIKEANCTLEHIVPQGKNGRGSFENWENIKKNKHDDIRSLLFNIGNLSILESKLNQDCKNNSFESKCHYYNKSKIIINKEIKNYSFNSNRIINAIKTRGKDVSKIIFDFILSQIKNYD